MSDEYMKRIKELERMKARVNMAHAKLARLVVAGYLLEPSTVPEALHSECKEAIAAANAFVEAYEAHRSHELNEDKV